MNALAPVTGGRIPRVLLADDDVAVASLFRDVLAFAGYDVVVVSDGLELLQHLGFYGDDVEAACHDFDVVVSDIRMPGVLGTEVLEGLAQLAEAPPVILISSVVDDSARRAASRYGAVGLLQKPLLPDDLIGAVAHALEHRLAP